MRYFVFFGGFMKFLFFVGLFVVSRIIYASNPCKALQQEIYPVADWNKQVETVYRDPHPQGTEPNISHITGLSYQPSVEFFLRALVFYRYEITNDLDGPEAVKIMKTIQRLERKPKYIDKLATMISHLLKMQNIPFQERYAGSSDWEFIISSGGNSNYLSKLATYYPNIEFSMRIKLLFTGVMAYHSSGESAGLKSTLQLPLVAIILPNEEHPSIEHELVHYNRSQQNSSKTWEDSLYGRIETKDPKQLPYGILELTQPNGDKRVYDLNKSYPVFSVDEALAFSLQTKLEQKNPLVYQASIPRSVLLTYLSWRRIELTSKDFLENWSSVKIKKLFFQRDKLSVSLVPAGYRKPVEILLPKKMVEHVREKHKLKADKEAARVVLEEWHRKGQQQREHWWIQVLAQAHAGNLQTLGIASSP